MWLQKLNTLLLTIIKPYHCGYFTTLLDILPLGPTRIIIHNGTGWGPRNRVQLVQF